MMKSPTECTSLEEVRTAIDTIDHQIIVALGKRFEYVQAAARFKTSETGVKAPERFAAMLQQRRVWAEENGLKADVIEQMYRDLVNYFIEEELNHWQR
jgi:isochorismate pyruvate lyase